MRSSPTLASERIEVASAGSMATASVQGRLVRADDGAAIPQLDVEDLQAPFAELAPPLRGVLGRSGGSGGGLTAARRTASGSDGTFVLLGLDREAHHRLRIGAGTALETTIRVARRLPADRCVDLGDILLAERCEVRGRVLDTAGVVVAGARVARLDVDASAPRLGEGLLLVPGPPPRVLETVCPDDDGWSARSDGEGRFVLAGTPARRTQVLVQATGFAEYVRGVETRPAASLDLGDLHLERLAPVRGRVLHAGGQPAAGLWIRAAAAGCTARLGLAFGHPLAGVSRSAEDGTFVVATPPGDPRWLAVRGEADALWQVIGPLAADEAVDVTLPPCATGLVEVRREDGSPVPAIQLGVQRCGPSGTSLDPLASPLGFSWALDHPEQVVERASAFAPVDALLRPVEDRPGRWRLVGLPTGDYRLLVEAPGFAPAGGFLALVAERENLLTLRLEPAVPRCIAVQGSDGRPVRGARVYWESTRPVAAEPQQLPPSPVPILLGRTDAAGTLANDRCGGGAFLVLHPDHAAARREPATGEAEVRIVLERLGSIEGRIEGPAAGRLLVSATYAADSPVFGGDAQHADVAADGSFVLPGLEPGGWRLAVSPRSEGGRGRPPSIGRSADLVEVEVAVPAGGCARVVLAVDGRGSGGSIEGRIQVSGQPARSLRVRAEPMGPLPEAAVPGEPRWSSVSRSVLTDEQGGFQISSLAAGIYRLTVAHAGVVQRPLWIEEVRVDRAALLRRFVDLELRDVRVEVVGADSRPVPHLELLLVGQVETDKGARSNGLQFRATSDSAGEAVIAQVPVGAYELTGRTTDGQLVVEPCRVVVRGGNATQRVTAIPRR
ncbi:MAG: hypothetical protein IPM29_26745 [Planctomycetes bacterium]|nr:hypothetical protein [Planctomycetota bacterium]